MKIPSSDKLAKMRNTKKFLEQNAQIHINVQNVLKLKKTLKNNGSKSGSCSGPTLVFAILKKNPTSKLSIL